MKLQETMRPHESAQAVDPARIAEILLGARVVLISEASHGTAEFYYLRAKVTGHLIAEHGFKPLEPLERTGVWDSGEPPETYPTAV